MSSLTIRNKSHAKTDPEDSQMVDSSASSDDEALFPSESLFPSSEHDAASAAGPRETDIGSSALSPPPSQEFPDASHGVNGADQLVLAARGNGSGGHHGWEPKSEFAKSAELGMEPGSCWKNKKARDEWQKAWNQIEDKGFSLSEFVSMRDGGDGWS